MNKQSVLIAACLICATPAMAEQNANVVRLAQATAPGKPVTTTTKPAPSTPVKDTVAPNAPPPPGTPNFPKRPANEPKLTNPLDKKK